MATIMGTTGNDILIGTTTADILRGLAGDDLLNGGPGADLLDGGDGHDTVTYADANGSVVVDISAGGIAGGDRFISVESLTGSSYDDTLLGDSGSNTLSGEDGDDILRGRGGADLLEGGAGTDLASYAGSAAAVTIDLAAGTGRGGDAEGDRLTSIEIVHGSSHGDTLYGSANGDTLRGWDGDDILRGRGGADLLEGGAGTDLASYAGSAAAVTIDLAAGTGKGGDAEGDRLTSIEIVHGSSHGDALYGSANDDTLRGWDGDDTLQGRGGADRIEGGNGNDTASYADAPSGVTVNLTTGLHLGSDAAGDVLVDIENLTGSHFDDVLTGNDTANVLTGGGGNDRLIAQGGADQLDGGDGIDIADYSAYNHAVIGGRTGISDRITEQLDFLSSIEIVIGTAFDDLIWNVGFDGKNQVLHEIHGGTGDDFLMDGVDDAVDTIEDHSTLFNGGDGNDWIQYISAGGALTINLDSGLGAGDIAQGDSYVGIENVIITARRITSIEGGVTTVTYRTTDDTIIGTDGANQIDGGGGADAIWGGGGDDYLIGRAGNARYDGGGGLDTIDYATGHSGTAGVTVDLAQGKGLDGAATGHTYFSIEQVIGTAASDILIGNSHDNLLTGGGGADRLTGGGGIDTAIYAGAAVMVDLAAGTGHNGDAEGDVLTGIENVIGTAANDQLSGDAGANVFDGRAGDDRLDGREGDDVLIGGAGADRLIGGDGRDTASYRGSSQGVQVDLDNATAAGGHAAGDVLIGIENLTGSAHADRLVGDAGPNMLTGDDGDDTLVGGGGDDVLIGGEGADSLNGGEGQDSAVYDTSTGAVTISLTTGMGRGGDAEGDVLVAIEVVSGSSFNDRLTGDADNNTLSGNDGDDILAGAAGDDTLSGGAGADRLDGGAGTDFALYDTSAAAVTIDLAAGTASGGSASGDLLISIENLMGSSFDDRLTGNGGVNVLIGGEGDDVLDGGGGNDSLIGGAGADRLIGGAGMDRAGYGTSAHAVTVDLSSGSASGGDAEGDVLSSIESVDGSRFDDRLTGDAAANTLSGGEGDDVLSGGAGNDVLIGGAGADQLTGVLESILRSTRHRHRRS
ncbi:beta strand repeat-containing protein [Tistrella mobilis]|uniref:Calcium binding hemolysin protein n=1 Tax=Tistrella mobilis (strain KA081020-065) TaxID=1110502 RepID=I3TI78_TISMK|nr:calcium-binding protein [Tistrella mobilis]AFK52466.1 calcium binding hemolysin protein [Tistrella mobilis KA081020-065]